MNENINELEGRESTTDTNASGLATLVVEGREPALTTEEVRGATPDTRVTDSDAVYGAGGHRRNGKIARLPKSVREEINELIDDGVEYEKIIETLGDEGKGLTKHNVSRWAQGGYRDWVKEQERRALLNGNSDRVVDLLTKAEPEEIPDLIVKLFAARLGGVLSDLTPQELRDNSEKNPRNLVRLLSVVPKLSREALLTRKYRQSVQREEAQELKGRDPKKPFGTDNDHRAVVDIVDRVLGLGQYTAAWIEELPTANYSSNDRSHSSKQDKDDQQSPRGLSNAVLPSAASSASESSNLESEIPSPPAPEVSPAQPQPPTNPDAVPAILDSEREERRPWNWSDLSNENIENWRKEHNL